MYKKVLAFFMVFIFALMPITEVMATPELRRQLEELTRQRNEARAQADQTQNLLEGIQSEISDLLVTMMEYELRIDNALIELDEIEIRLVETQIELSYAEADLDEARADHATQEELFRMRLRAIHEQGPVGYLEVLFQSTSFTDFLVRLEQVRAIARFDQQVLADMEAAEIRLAESVAALEVVFSQLAEQQAEQRLAIVALDRIVDEQEQMLLAMRDNEEAIAVIYEFERLSQIMLEAEMGTISEEIARIQREEDRRRAEAAAAAAAAQRAEQAARRQADLAHLNDPSNSFQWPVPTHSHVSSPFGNRTHPISGRQERHDGIDIPAPTGTRIVAAEEGIVRTSGRLGGYGLTIIIDHGNGYSTLYAHNSRNRVNVGDHVTRNQHIADVGSTGVSTGPHLHFEIRVNNVPRNPMPYFNR